MGRSKRQKATQKAETSLVPAEEVEVDLTSTTSVPGDWDSLPPEIQEIILNNVDTPKELLSCRGVNSAWKNVVDATLEKQCFSGWLTWTPFSVPERRPPQTPNIPGVMKLRHIWVGRPDEDLRLSLAWNNSSLPAVKNLKLGSPFPGNSMHLMMATTTSDPFPVVGKNRDTMVKELAINYGHYLTSFVLSNFTTNLDDLRDLLRQMLNLKALTLKSVRLNPSSSPADSCLPLLFSLTHLKVVSCISSVSQLLLNSYGGQLISVETGSYLRPCHRPFTNLKQLKLEVDIKPNLSFPQLGSSPFPALQQLSVIHTSQHYNWMELIPAVNNFPKTLTHLHLDIPMLESNPELATLSKDEVSFLCLKKLGIPFPHSQHGAESMGRWLLPKFPNMEELQLIRYHYPYNIDHNPIIDEVVAAAGFWRCSKLQKIVVFKGGDNTVMRVLTRNEVQ